MRRAIVQNLRTFRRPTPRKALKTLRISGANNVSFQRSIASRNLRPLHSSMQFRRLSGPLALGVGAGAIYYAYQNGVGQTTDAASATSLAGSQARAYSNTPSVAYAASSTSPVDGLSSSQVPEAVRKALIVEQGQLFTAQIPADVPISKETDHSGRKVLEMLTPEQADAKLRTNEESYLVNRAPVPA